jgi:hypothetical protein
MLLYFGFPYGILIFALYTLMVLIDAFSKTKSVAVSFKSVLAVYVQFFGYGLGFLRSVFRLYVQGKDIRTAFPGMFA